MQSHHTPPHFSSRHPWRPIIVLMAVWLAGFAMLLNASDTAVTVWINMPKPVPAPGVLSGSGMIPASITVSSLPAHGSVTIDPQGGYVFVPTTNWWGSDAFTWKAIDAKGVVLTGTVSVTIAPPPVRLNEIFTHTDPPNSGGVELHNPLAVEVDISGWVITGFSTLGTGPYSPLGYYVIPTGTIMQPGEYRTYVRPWSDGQNIPWGVMPFSITSFGAALYLHSMHGGRPSGIHCGALVPPCPKPYTFGWYQTSDGREVFQFEKAQTFGRANAGVYVGPVVISEIATRPAPVPGDAAYLELTNRTGNAVVANEAPRGVPRTPWRLMADATVLFNFPAGFTFASGETILLVDVGTDIAAFRALHHLPTGMRIMAMTSAIPAQGLLELQRPMEITQSLLWFCMERVGLRDVAPWPLCVPGAAIRRTVLDGYGDDPGCWSAGPQTPGVPEGAASPLTQPDTYDVEAEGCLVVDADHGVLANDRDPGPNGDSLTVTRVTGPTQGGLRLRGDGSFTYLPKPGISGVVDHFTYRTVDISKPMSEITTVTVRIGTIATPLIVRPDRYETTVNAVLTVAAAQGVLVNDHVLGGGAALRAELVTGPAGGSVMLAGDGGFTWKPVPGFVGRDGFTYRVWDGRQWSGPVPVTLIADGPVLPWVKGLDISYAPGFFPDTDAVLAAVPLTRGTTTAVSIPSRNLDDHFGYVYTGAIDLAVAGRYQFHLSSDDGARLWIGGVLVIDNDGPLHIAGERSASLVVAPGTEGRRSFRVAYYQDIGTLSLAVGWTQPNGTRQMPIPGNGPLYRLDREAFRAVDDAYATSAGTTLTVAGRSSVLANDKIPAGGARNWELITPPAVGSFTGPMLDGGFTYQPPAGFNGFARFTYRIVSDGFRSAPATATITVGALDPITPVSADDAYILRQDATLVVPPATGVLANDRAPSGSHLTASLKTNPAHGRATLSPDGGFTYVPAPGFIGVDRFTYRASDGVQTTVATALITTLPRGRLDRMEIAPRRTVPGPTANLSGLTWHPERRHWYGVAHGSSTWNPSVIYEWDETLTTLLRRMTVVGEVDCGDIAWMEGDSFAIVGEVGHLIAITTINDATVSVSVAVNTCQRYILPSPSDPGLSWNGVAYDPAGANGRGTFFAVEEKAPSRLVAFDRLADRTTLKDFLVNQQFALTDLHDVRGAWTPTGVATDLSAVAFDRRAGTLLVLSQESCRLLELTRSGVLIGSRDLPTVAAGGASQCEGLGLGPDGEIIIASEPNLILKGVWLPTASQ